MAKRILAMLLCAVLSAMALAVPASAAERLLYGDLNRDGQHTAIDYIMLRRYLLGSYELQKEVLPAADLDQNGEIGVQDYMLLRLILLGAYEAEELPSESETPSDALIAAVKFSFLLKNGSEEELLLLESELNMELDLLNQLIVGYLASVSVDGETMLELESEIAFDLSDPEEIRLFAESLADSLADTIAEWLTELLRNQD